MKKVLSVFLALVAVVTIAACNNDKKPTDGVGYGLVHDHYVGKTSLTVDAEGLVTAAKIDEYYLPYNIANVTGQVGTYKGVGYGLVHGHYVGMVNITTDKAVVTEAEIDEYYLPYNLANLANQTVASGATDVVTVAGTSGDTVYAKYFSVNGTLWTSKDSNAWFNSSDVNIEEWVKTPANAKAYAEACDNDQVFIANSDGSKHATYKTQYEIAANNGNTDGQAKTGVARYLKSTTGYGGTRWDWEEAMDGLVELFVGSKMDLNMADAELNDDGYWEIGDITTDATLVDFKDYYGVAVTAYNAKTIVASSAPADTFVDGTKLYAKYVKVGDILFTGTAGTTAGTPIYSASGIANIEEWVKTPANAKTYAEACDAGNVYLATSAGAQHATYKTFYAFANNLTGVNQFLKSTTGYGGTRWDWKDAMEKLEKLFKGSKMDLNMANAEINDDGYWEIGGVTTDSTLVDFKDYYGVAVTAYNDAISKR